MDGDFQIHPQLLADCHWIAGLTCCDLLLHKNAGVPWFILVPRTALTEFLNLDESFRSSVLQECERVAAYLKQRFGVRKLNFAAIGNVVPQMHLHVVGRSETDCCWPKVVWGNLASEATYDESLLAAIREEFAR